MNFQPVAAGMRFDFGKLDCLLRLWANPLHTLETCNTTVPNYVGRPRPDRHLKYRHSESYADDANIAAIKSEDDDGTDDARNKSNHASPSPGIGTLMDKTV